MGGICGNGKLLDGEDHCCLVGGELVLEGPVKHRLLSSNLDRDVGSEVVQGIGFNL